MVLNVLLIFALIALVGALFLLRRSPETFRPIAYGLVGLVVVLVVIRLVHRGGGAPAPIVIAGDFHTATGYQLGRQVARAVPGGGDILVVFSGEGNALVNEVSKAQLAGLKQGLGDGPYRLVTTAPTPADDAVLLGPEPYLPMRLFARFMKAAPDAKAIVSFMGSPVKDDGSSRQLPPLFVVGMVSPEVIRPLVARGTIRAAVLFKPGVDWNAKPEPGMTLDQVFDLRYTLLTAP